MSWLPSIWRSACACSAALLLSGCAGALEDPARFAYLDAGPGSDAGVARGDGGCDPVTTIFIPSCTTSSCHSARAQQGNLDLESPGLPHRLVNAHASGGPGLIINPQSPDQSVLYTKLLDPPPFKFQMPLGLPPLGVDDLACIQEWVRAAR
jgi:hypothetical protein